MKKILSSLASLSFVALVSYATAQPVLQADIAVLQPQISRDSIGFDRCGIRAVVSLFDPQRKDAETYDFSVMLDAAGPYAILKGGKNSARFDPVRQKLSDPKITLPAPSSFWIADALDGKSATIEKTFPGESKGYILGLAETGPAFKAIRAMMEGRRAQFVMRYKSEKIDKVISFAAKLSPEEIAPLERCFEDLIERMKNEAPAIKKD